jgi:hypothetical protein
MKTITDLKTGHDAEGKLMHLCQYCDVWFYPTRRWVHKYCSSSCRVTACKERKKGVYGVVIGGNLRDKRNATTNTDLQNSLIENTELIKSQHLENRKQIELGLLDIKLDMNRGLDKIQTKLNWNMLLTTVIPFIAPMLTNWASTLFEKIDTEPLDAESLKKKLEKDFGGKIPQEMKEKIFEAVDSYIK